ncbi:MAG: tripartite tricarboxylate transporter TctB family protein [Pyramidobacter sp.]|nr:tripartite tricarboxylate transporter TctB family protein [Pyramidobacter sp.]
MKFNKNTVFSLALMVFAGFVIFLSLNLKSLFLAQSGDIGPKAFPIGASVALVICAAGKILTDTAHNSKPFLSAEGWKRVVVMFCILAAYLIALDWLGYIISTLLFTPLMVVTMKENQKLNPLALGLFSVVITAVLYVVFQSIIMVTLPVGRLFL